MLPDRLLLESSTFVTLFPFTVMPNHVSTGPDNQLVFVFQELPLVFKNRSTNASESVSKTCAFNCLVEKKVQRSISRIKHFFFMVEVFGGEERILKIQFYYKNDETFEVGLQKPRC